MKRCSNPMPASAGSGHWREWHRGHGCDLDDTPIKPVIIQPEPEWSPYRDAHGFGPVRAFWEGL